MDVLFYSGVLNELLLFPHWGTSYVNSTSSTAVLFFLHLSILPFSLSVSPLIKKKFSYLHLLPCQCYNPCKALPNVTLFTIMIVHSVVGMSPMLLQVALLTLWWALHITFVDCSYYTTELYWCTCMCPLCWALYRLKPWSCNFQSRCIESLYIACYHSHFTSLSMILSSAKGTKISK